MSKQANPAIIGLFVLGGFILSIVTIVLLSKGGFFKERHDFVMYFSGSVNGLSVGAPVTMRGVQVGIVKHISLVQDFTRGEIIIPVVAEFYPGNVIPVGKKKTEPVKETAKKLVEEFGLRAQLQTQSIITGQLYVQLDFHPRTAYRYYGGNDDDGDDGDYDYDDKIIEIPIIPSTLELLEKKLEKFELSSLVEDLSSAAKAISHLANKPELGQSIRELETTLATIHSLAHSADARLIPLSNKVERLLDGLQGTLSRIDTAATNFKELSDTESPTIYKVNTAMDELIRAAKSIRTLADMLENHPEVLIHGKGTGK